ncbi:MAG TPA: dTMP kinase [Nocardioidaceae bacterium]|nr:dTMP kinase [Nocardioidaceae bacterium]
MTEPAARRLGGSVLGITAFRRLWIGLGLSSLGDWLGLLALTAMASALAPNSYADQSFAISGVLLLRVLPAIVMGPLAGYVADRLDRRWTLVVGDLLRGAVFVSIPIVDTLTWVLVATVIIEAISLVWLPAKDATVPNLVPPRDLQTANQISIATTYGSALPAAGIFVLLSLGTKGLHSLGWLGNAPVTLSLYFNAASFVVSGLVIVTLREIPSGPAVGRSPDQGVWKIVREGWAFVGRDPMVRGLVLGITGAFAAGGVVIGLARVYVGDLGGGNPGYGMLFAAVFAGLAVGMWRGPRFLLGMSRRRLFGFALVAGGVTLAAIAVIANLVVVTGLTVVLGFFAGTAWITGYTLLGLEVDDAIRGRTFAFVQTLIRLTLALVLAAAPAAAGVIGRHQWRIDADAVLTYNGAAITLFGSAVAMTIVGLVAYHHMNDRPGVSIATELRQSFMRNDGVYPPTGVFVALEGGEGVGKSTQARLLGAWLTEQGYDVVLTHEPGDSAVGRKLRDILLDPETGELDHRAEMLLYAADKAEHVDKVVRPALARGAIVVTDRYVDSTLAYQGAGRALEGAEVAQVATWATGGLRPNLTVVLDLDPDAALARIEYADRLEAEPVEFHRRVRAFFLARAAADPEHYLVLDAALPRDELAVRIRDRLAGHLGGVAGHQGAPS